MTGPQEIREVAAHQRVVHFRTEDLIEAIARAQYEREVASHHIFDHGPWEQLTADYRDWFIPNAARAVDAVLPLIADAIEALDADWHFRGPGDPGILVVSQAAAVELVRSLLGGDRDSYDPYWEGWDDGMGNAARVVRQLSAPDADSRSDGARQNDENQPPLPLPTP